MKKILMILFCATIALGIGGCSKEAKPSEAVTGFIEAFKKQNQEEMNGFTVDEFNKDDFFNFDAMDDSIMNESQKTSMNSMVTKMSEVDCTIKEEGSIDGDSANVTVTITTYNFGDKLKSGIQEAITNAFSLAFDKSLSEEEKNSKMNDILIKHLDSAEKNYRKDIIVKVKKIDDEWKVDSQNSDFLDALSGGMISTGEEISNSFNN